MKMHMMLYFLYSMCMYALAIVPDAHTKHDISKGESVWPFNTENDGCVRHRKPWYQLSSTERDFFLEGFRMLRMNTEFGDRLTAFTLTHKSPSSEMTYLTHATSMFPSWHGYLLWELETQVRAMGDEWKCWSVPYWDWWYDTMNMDDPPILRSGIGGNGAESECVSGPEFSLTEFNSPWKKLCSTDDEIYPKCCLKRDTSVHGSLSTLSELSSIIRLNDRYDNFMSVFEDWHTPIHQFLASNNKVHMAGAFSTEDPVFWMLHSSMNMIFALWINCHGYDLISYEDLHEYPKAFTSFCTSLITDHPEWCSNADIDGPLPFSYLTNTDWSLASKMKLTQRQGYDITSWNVKYELGAFYSQSKTDRWCPLQTINDEWFTHQMINDDKNIIYGTNNIKGTLIIKENKKMVSGTKEEVFKEKVNYFMTRDEFNNNAWFEKHSYNPFTLDSSLIKETRLAFYMRMVWRLMDDLNIGIIKENEMIDAYGITHQLIEDEEMFGIAGDLSCDFQRRYGNEHFCFSKEIEIIEIEKCDGYSFADAEQLTLEQMLDMNGVKDNECLRSIRTAFYPWTEYDVSSRIALCNGRFDYQCPVSSHNLKSKIKYNALQAVLREELDVGEYYEFKHLWKMRDGRMKNGVQLRMQYSSGAIGNEEELQEIINDEKQNGTPFKKHVSMIAVVFSFFMSIVIAFAIAVGVYQQWKKKRVERMMNNSGRDFVAVRMIDDDMAKENTPLISF